MFSSNRWLGSSGSRVARWLSVLVVVVLVATIAVPMMSTMGTKRAAGQESERFEVSTTIRANQGWQVATDQKEAEVFYVNKGEQFSIYYTGGLWTVDNRTGDYPLVGPDGYDEGSTQCSFMDTDKNGNPLSFGSLLIRIGEDDVNTFQVFSNGQNHRTIVAGRDGAVYFRINDSDREISDKGKNNCIGDNAGAMNVSLRLDPVTSTISGCVEVGQGFRLRGVQVSLKDSDRNTIISKL